MKLGQTQELMIQAIKNLGEKDVPMTCKAIAAEMYRLDPRQRPGQMVAAPLSVHYVFSTLDKLVARGVLKLHERKRFYEVVGAE